MKVNKLIPTLYTDEIQKTVDFYVQLLINSLNTKFFSLEEVSSKWAERQQINGPILTIPLIYEYDIDDKIITTIRYWYLLPENLKIDGIIEP